jgi:hypothetical protein
MELSRTTKLDLDISSEAEILAYTFTGQEPREVMIRADLGDNSAPIAGGSIYRLNAYINGVLITPSSDVNVPTGTTRTIVVSRPLPVSTDDLLSVRAIGGGADTSVNTVASLRDVSPVTINEVQGNGPIVVDHNYGGTDALRYTTSLGAGVDQAVILAYLTSDYDDNKRGNAFVVAKSFTTTDGRWGHPIQLDPADYTIIFTRPGLYGPDRRDVSVLPV